jgi:GDP-mannose 6-dehydrogenase
MRISVFGLGYVGAVSCGCLAKIGHDVIGVDVNEDKVALVQDGRAPVMEPGLEELIAHAVANGNLIGTTSAMYAVEQSDLALICVGTPSNQSGGINTSFLEGVVGEIGACIGQLKKDFFAVLNRSTCLPGLQGKFQEILSERSGREMGDGIGYACHPEFLREAAAINDFFDPPRLLFGTTDSQTQGYCNQLYPDIDAPIFFTTPEEASMVKYADNCFHALKVTFANEIGAIAREFNVDSRVVMDVFSQDNKLNISKRYLRPGGAFGGSCLPKDLRAVLDASRMTARPLPMLSGVMSSNRSQVEHLFDRILSDRRPNIGVIGLSFKENTDDVRESPLVTLVESVTGKGHQVRIFDAYLAADNLVGSNRSFALNSIPHLEKLLSSDLQEVVDFADVIVINHRLSPEVWDSVSWRDDQRIIDIASVPELAKLPGYEGIYW